MKLTSFLQEETTETLDISSFIENLKPEEQQSIKEFMAKFKGFNKITLNDISADDMFIHITDGIVDFDFSFSKDLSSTDDGYEAVVEIASMVNHKFVFGHEKMSEHETHKYALTQTFSREFLFRRKDRLFEYVDYILKVANAFNDWYFDMSGEYGKLKLIKTPYDVVDGSSNNEWKWIPVGGVFFAAGQTNNDTIRAEVL